MLHDHGFRNTIIVLHTVCVTEKSANRNLYLINYCFLSSLSSETNLVAQRYKYSHSVYMFRLIQGQAQLEDLDMLPIFPMSMYLTADRCLLMFFEVHTIV